MDVSVIFGGFIIYNRTQQDQQLVRINYGMERTQSRPGHTHGRLFFIGSFLLQFYMKIQFVFPSKQFSFLTSLSRSIFLFSRREFGKIITQLLFSGNVAAFVAFPTSNIILNYRHSFFNERKI